MAAGDTTRDSGFIARAFEELLAEKTEFPIRVEGAKTLPYTAVVQASDPEGRTLILKLFRPLPPALMVGAWFGVVFAVQDRRYEGRIALRDRDGYLRYRFEWPKTLVSSDRRVWKRYTFRPREDVFVTAQDCETPSHGLTGPLTSLSQGGFCMRVDRMLRLEDGLPVRPRANLFDRGRSLSPVRIHGLLRDEVLEVRGQIVRIQEGDSEIQLAVQFNELREAVSVLLSQVLASRERQAGRGGGAGSAPPRPAHGETVAAEGGAPGPAPAPVDDLALAAAGREELLRLDRRTVRLLLVAQEGEDRAGLVRSLRTAGYWRVDLAADLAAAVAAHGQAGAAPFRLLVVDLEAGRRSGLEALGAVRQLEPQLGAFGALPVAFATRLPDPMLELVAGPGREAAAREDPDPGRWTAVLDRLMGLRRPPPTSP
jgi:CheY-like chemotaxis protein